jgi:TNF receptor-associated protein 1
MPTGQTAIYYLVAPQRGIAEASPYMEAFRGARGSNEDVEVLFLYSTVDDFVMNNLREYNGRKFTTIETANLDPATLQGVADKSKTKDSEASADKSEKEAAFLAPEQVKELGDWLVAALPTRLSAVRGTERLRSSPAVVTDHESASLRRMMRMVESTAGKDSGAVKLESHVLPKQTLEINPKHAVIVRLHKLRLSDEPLARVVAEQLVDNALVAAGLIDDPRSMLPRLAALLETVVGLGGAAASYPGAATIESKRHVPLSEKAEREQISLGEEVAEMIEKKSLNK